MPPSTGSFIGVKICGTASERKAARERLAANEALERRDAQEHMTNSLKSPTVGRFPGPR